MKGDFTRFSFEKTKHYSSVRMQQGRVQVDADANEQTDIQAHLSRTTTKDVVGLTGAPIHDAGFALTIPGDGALHIGAGRFYVDGILCENEDDVVYGSQQDLKGSSLPVNAGTYLGYLDVWERLLTTIERPELREVALGGPDTATRTKVVWQVKLLPNATTCSDYAPPWKPNPAAKGQLKAQAVPEAPPTTACAIPPGAGYLRLENQLYRVQIQASSDPGPATFIWSRDNGSILATLEDIQNDVITISDPRDTSLLGFANAKWVELSDESRALQGLPGVLVELASVQANQLTVKTWPSGPLTKASFGDRPTVRRWESAATPVTLNTWLDLEDGVQVWFTAGTFSTGDYWTIPARTALASNNLGGTIEWPGGPKNPGLLDPQGIRHHYAALGLLSFNGAKWSVSDCRHLFPPLTEVTSLFYVGGDGQEAMPDVAHPANLIPLALPLQVGIPNRLGAKVRFQVTIGAGRLQGTGAAVDVLTGNDGIASCKWELDPTTEDQQVEVWLLNDLNQHVPLPIRFNAHLSVAGEVAYYPKGCSNLKDTTTVQNAIDRLTQLPAFAYDGGDGQQGMPDPLQPGKLVSLAHPLQVSVKNDCGPVNNAKVRFTKTQGNGQLENNGDVTTQANGIASCHWDLDPTTQFQQVQADLLDNLGATVAPIFFGASLSRADATSYDPKNCQVLTAAKANTVQSAIDELCKNLNPKQPGIHIKEVVTIQPKKSLGTDLNLFSNELASGIAIACDAPIDPLTIYQPTCFVTVDVPYPIDSNPWDLAQGLVGYQPLILNAEVGLSDPTTIRWAPGKIAQTFLEGSMFRVLLKLGIDRVLAHLTLKGNYIFSTTNSQVSVGGGAGTRVNRAGALPDLYLDGETYGTPAPPPDRTAWVLPSGDGRKGGDFEIWFWLNWLRIATFAFSPPPIKAGTPATATISLNLPAPFGATVQIAASPSGSAAPIVGFSSPVTIPAGADTVSFPITPLRPGAVTLTATLDSNPPVNSTLTITA